MTRRETPNSLAIAVAPLASMARMRRTSSSVRARLAALSVLIAACAFGLPFSRRIQPRHKAEASRLSFLKSCGGALQ